MTHRVSLSSLDRTLTEAIWDQLSAQYRQPALTLLAQLAIKRVVQEVADAEERERLWLAKKSPRKTKSPRRTSNA